VLSGSRGGYVSLAFGLVVFTVLSWVAMRRASKHQIWVSALGAIVIAALVIGSIAAIFSRHYALQSRASRVFDTSDIRVELWKTAYQQYKLSPLIGTGGATYQYHAREFRPAQIQVDPVYAHNDYLQLLAEYGSVGLVAALVFIFCHVWFGWKALIYSVTERPAARFRMQSNALALNIGALASIAIYLVHSFLDFNLHIPANAMLMGFIFGMLANPGIVMPNVNETHEKVSRYLKLALPAIGVWIAAFGLPTLPAEYFAEQSRVALREERYEEAITFAELGLAGDKKNPYLSLYLGQAHASLAESTTNSAVARSSYTAAVDAFRHGIQLYPKEQWLLVGLGSALDGLGRFDEARNFYKKAVAANPTSGPIHLYYATHLRLAGKLDEAEEMYKKSLRFYWNQGAVVGLELVAKAKLAGASGH